MKNEQFESHGVRNTQLAAYILNNVSCLVLIVLVILGLLGVMKASDIPQWVTLFNGTVFSFTGLVSYLLLSRIAANVATRNVVKYAGIFWFVGNMMAVAFDYYRFNYEVSTIAFSCCNAILFIVKTASMLYLFGCIVRNNPDCRSARTAINLLYIVTFLLMYVGSAIAVPLLKTSVSLDLLELIKCVVWIIGSYILFTSSVFNGQTSVEPAPKGAYRFWNKYFTWYIVTMFATVIAIVIIEV